MDREVDLTAIPICSNKHLVLEEKSSFFLAKKSKRVTIVARNPMKTTKYHLQFLKRDRTL